MQMIRTISVLSLAYRTLQMTTNLQVLALNAKEKINAPYLVI